MDEVGGALVAIALVLSAVFVPTAFIPGISGQFYRQFALTIASATIISCIVSLTLSPALAALLLQPRTHEVRSRSRAGRIVARFFSGFNTAFDRTSDLYGRAVGKLVRVSGLVLGAYAGLIAADRRPVLARARRLHPCAGSGVFRSPRAVATGLVVGAHGRGGAAGHRGDPRHPWRRARRELHRFRRRLGYECQQRGDAVLHPDAVRRT